MASTTKLLCCCPFLRLYGRPISAVAAFHVLSSRQGVFSCCIGKGKSNNNRSSLREKKAARAAAESLVKRRTRSLREFDKDLLSRYLSEGAHIPVLLGEVLDVYRGRQLRSFIDCTVGAAGHSSAVNNAGRGFSVLNNGPLDMRMNPLASLKAEDILNSWPEHEVGRILREYGEESNWWSIQTKIVKARLDGGLHSTGELVELVKNTSGRSGRRGWIKTATRVFQALRIAVNDELKTLEDALYSCFDCLSSGGRMAVISFHSLEDRIVKKTFLDIINQGDGNEERFRCLIKESNSREEESWSRQKIGGSDGIILTKRSITPSEEEERLNPRCRSAKLRVIQKA